MWKDKHNFNDKIFDKVMRYSTSNYHYIVFLVGLYHI